jgi:predicted dehydrogenase
MRQVVQDLRSGALEVVEVPDPVPGPNEVVVRTRASLISAGTEQAVVRAASKGLIGKARERPDALRAVVDKVREEGVGPALSAVRARLDDLVLHGYSSAGVVDAVGRDVRDIRAGDRVACVGANIAFHAERAAVPAPLCIPLPDGLSFEEGAFGAVGSIAAHGLRLASVEPGAVVVVVGLGLVGQLAAQLCTTAGARVIGLDIAPAKVEVATRLGAVGGGTSADAEVTALLASLSGGHGADAVVITAATRDAGALDLAARLARDRATVCVVGDVPLAGSRNLYFEKELQLRVSRSYGPGRYDPRYELEGHDYPIGYVRWTERRLVRYVLEEAAAGRIRLVELITHRFPIEDAEDAYEALGAPGRLAVVLTYDGESRPGRRVTLRAPAVGKQVSRVGLIGPGMFARSTLLPIVAAQGVELVAVAGTSPARAFGTGRRWGAAYVASDADELIRDDSIDVLVIATRHDTHAALATRALEAGKAVFLEKPLALTEDELALLLPLLERGERLVVDFNRTFAPASGAVRAHFANRVDPISVLYRVNAGFVEPGSWVRDTLAGGGRLIGEACHFVDFCGSLIGAGVALVATTPLGASPRTLAGDNFVLTLTYHDGSVGTIAYVANGCRRVAKERIEIHGAGRSAVVDDFRRVELDGKSGRRSRRDKGHAAIVAEAFRFFRSGGAPPIPYERLLETTRVTFVAGEALSSGVTTVRAVPVGQRNGRAGTGQ